MSYSYSYELNDEHVISESKSLYMEPRLSEALNDSLNDAEEITLLN